MTEETTPPHGFGAALLAKLVRVEPGEGRALFLSAAYFFFILSSYYVIRPLRDMMGIAGRDDVLSMLFLGTLGGTLLANPLFGALVSRYPRRVFIPVVYRFLIANLVLFWALLTFLPEGRRLAVAHVFFVWTSVF
ncbi:MAG TPA: MFS transporter, partial [Thermoanaerobaculia bacterium]|nr:MFS transporter [Thermoanaerobaculia bacterium]